MKSGNRTNDSERMEELAAAQDLRRQIQEKYLVGKRVPLTTAQDVPKFMTEHVDYLRKVAAGMGYEGEEASAFLRQTQDSLVELSLSSPLDEPMFHSVAATHCDDIEKVCGSLDLPLRSGVAYGAIPSIGLDVAQHPVPMTEASVVSVSKMFIPFCGIISKVLARSLPHDVGGRATNVSFVLDRVFKNINADVTLKKYWFETIASFALFGTPTLVKPDVISGPAAITRGQVLAAMELFAFAHEYGHHIANRRLKGVASAHTDDKMEGYSDELEADYLACVICTHVGLRQKPQNPYCLWGAGGVLVLKSLELVRRARHTLTSGAQDAPLPVGHPPVADRIAAMEAFNHMAPKNQKGPSEELRKFFERLMDRLWTGMHPIFFRLYSGGVRPPEPGGTFEGWTGIPL